MALSCVVRDTGPNPSRLVLWMHGLGADGHDFEPVVPAFAGLQPATRFVFPHAPKQPVTINNGLVMRAWYDITGLDIDRGSDRAGIERSAALIEQLLDEQREAGFDAAQTVLAGFSQGGAMALHIGLRHAQRLAGIIALSCYLPMPDRLADERHPANADVPIFMGHGVHDPVVPHALGQASRDRLTALGYTVDWHDYPLQHGVSMEEIGAVAEWLQQLPHDVS